MPYNEETYSGSSVVETNMQQVEDNWPYLRQNFIGSTAPANPAAGQIWIDNSTTPVILKIRNNANTAWLSIWNLTDNCLYGLTATIAELNTVADGTTARNLHKHANIGIAGGSGIDVNRSDLGDSVTISCTAPPPLVLPNMPVEEATAFSTTDYSDFVDLVTFRFYLPANAGTIKLAARVRVEQSEFYGRIRLDINGDQSSYYQFTNTGYSWVTSGLEVDVSAMAEGWKTGKIQMRVEQFGEAYLKGYAFHHA